METEMDFKDEPLRDEDMEVELETPPAAPVNVSQHSPGINVEDLQDDYFADLIGLNVVDEWVPGNDNNSKKRGAVKHVDPLVKIEPHSPVVPDDDSGDTVPFEGMENTAGTVNTNMSERLQQELSGSTTSEPKETDVPLIESTFEVDSNRNDTPSKESNVNEELRSDIIVSDASPSCPKSNEQSHSDPKCSMRSEPKSNDKVRSDASSSTRSEPNGNDKVRSNANSSTRNDHTPSKRSEPKASDKIHSDPKANEKVRSDPKASNTVRSDPKSNTRSDSKANDKVRSDPKANEKSRSESKSNSKPHSNNKANDRKASERNDKDRKRESDKRSEHKSPSRESRRRSSDQRKRSPVRSSHSTRTQRSPEEEVTKQLVVGPSSVGGPMPLMSVNLEQQPYISSMASDQGTEPWVSPNRSLPSPRPYRSPRRRRRYSRSITPPSKRSRSIRRSRSPRWRSRSPRAIDRSRSPGRRIRSPDRRVRSPGRRLRSPGHKSRSPNRRRPSYSRSPRRRSTSRSPNHFGPKREHDDEIFFARMRSRKQRQQCSGSPFSMSRSPSPESRRIRTPLEISNIHRRSPRPSGSALHTYSRKQHMHGSSSPFRMSTSPSQESHHVKTPLETTMIHHRLPMPPGNEAGTWIPPSQWNEQSQHSQPFISQYPDPNLLPQQQQQQAMPGFFNMVPLVDGFQQQPPFFETYDFQQQQQQQQPCFPVMVQPPQPIPSPMLNYPPQPVPPPNLNFPPVTAPTQDFPNHQRNTNSFDRLSGLRVKPLANLKKRAPVLYQISSDSECDSDEFEVAGIPTDIPLSHFLEATIEGQNAKPPLRQHVVERVAEFVRNITADVTVVQPYKFSVAGKRKPCRYKPPITVSQDNPSPLLKAAFKDAQLNLSIQPVDINAVRMPENPLFASKVKQPPPKPPCASVGINTDPVPERPPPKCLNCYMRNQREFMNRWTQTLPPVKHSVYIQAGRGLELTHDPVAFRHHGDSRPEPPLREVVYVEEDLHYTPRRPPAPPAPPLYPAGYRDLDQPPRSDIRSRLAPLDERVVRYSRDHTY